MAAAGGLSRDLLDRVAARLPDAPLVVALSGGADSAALARCLLALGRAVRAVTVDHGLPASGDLVEGARRVAAELGLDHEVVEVPPASGEGPLRDVRLEALEAAARPGEVVATGHTADDQAETVLGNLLRGAGAAGLSGIPGSRTGWVRPFLGVTREEARAAADGLPFVDDPDNVDPDVRRSWLRTRAIPFLEDREGDRVRPALRRAGGLLAADDALLERRAAAVPVLRRDPFVAVAAAPLTTLPGPVAARVARRLLRTAVPPYAGAADDVDGVLQVARSGRSRSVLGRLVSREGGLVVVGPEATEPPGPADLGTGIRWGRWTFTVGGDGPGLSRRSALLPADRRPFRVRAWAPGDRLDTEIGSKPVAEILREVGVPARFRPEWPVVDADGTMAWVVGGRLATWARPDPTATTIRITAREARWTSATS
ncbi:MAG: tRNA lysidine(34) synthetase TilS [Acidimicrobiia bacterium]|nr:tRNA lysidine(34) synthetase TilS [Acidimicrobiia bacterium]